MSEREKVVADGRLIAVYVPKTMYERLKAEADRRASGTYLPMATAVRQMLAEYLSQRQSNAA